MECQNSVLEHHKMTCSVQKKTDGEHYYPFFQWSVDKIQIFILLWYVFWIASHLHACFWKRTLTNCLWNPNLLTAFIMKPTFWPFKNLLHDPKLSDCEQICDFRWEWYWTQRFCIIWCETRQTRAVLGQFLSVLFQKFTDENRRKARESKNRQKTTWISGKKCLSFLTNKQKDLHSWNTQELPILCSLQFS